MSDAEHGDAATIEHEFLGRIAKAIPNAAKGVELAALARWLLEQLDGQVPDRPQLRKAADRVVNLASKRWPNNTLFVEALKAPGVKPKHATPLHWRPGPKPLHCTDLEWEHQALRQEAAARRFVRSDLEARELAQKACREAWANAYWMFLVEHGRLPSPDEQRRLVAAARKNQVDVPDAGSMLGKMYSELQAKARKELGCG